MATRKKIAADGSIVSEDGSNSAENPSTSSASILSGGAGSSLCSIRHVDVFGFNLDLRQFVVVLGLAALMLGTKGAAAFLLAMGAYTLFQRATAGSGEGSGVSIASAGRGGWNNGGGANIRGMQDLPKPVRLPMG
eukprot:CAMPEP_0197446334 /NCGR_PEP_ID=MMETSP1175-20131217/11304_1 /TAXON_ID=1003142 /ORGANISM="Triceratium dubium, Strain CCMP147" /LENGTH=134 /DNA_ID=CAMNT_0042977429 /DNA_START=8 /DNA_END=412 /DNA_ORIENTATION=+